MGRLFLALTALLVMTLPVSTATFPDVEQLRQMTARFASTPLSVDTSHLSPGDKKALAKLIEAARKFDPLFMNQLWSGNERLYHELSGDHTALGRARLHLFWISKGPWSDLDDHRAFLPGVPERKPLGANFYPLDMSKAEFEQWASKLPEREATAAKGFFTVIRRDSNTNQLRIVSRGLARRFYPASLRADL